MIPFSRVNVLMVLMAIKLSNKTNQSFLLLKTRKENVIVNVSISFTEDDSIMIKCSQLAFHFLFTKCAFPLQTALYIMRHMI